MPPSPLVTITETLPPPAHGAPAAFIAWNDVSATSGIAPATACESESGLRATTASGAATYSAHAPAPLAPG